MTFHANAGVARSAQERWRLFEGNFGDRARASDIAWARHLTPAERLAVVDDLLNTVRTAHEVTGDWDAVEAVAWRETLAERRRLVAAFQTLDEVRLGSAPLADAG